MSMMTSSEALSYLRDRDAALERLLVAVKEEGLPVLLAAHTASPGALPVGSLLSSLVRVGLVEQRSDAWGCYDVVWLEAAAWRVDGPLLLESRARDYWQLYSRREGNFCQEQGGVDRVVWLRERGTLLSSEGDPVPWIHCGGHRGEDQTVHREPRGDVERLVLPAARRWIGENGYKSR